MSPRPRKASDNEVFGAAMRVMSRVGPADLTLSAIAAEAGLTPGALVQRFGSKQRLLRTISSQLGGAAAEIFAQLRSAHPSPLAALRDTRDARRSWPSHLTRWRATWRTCSST